MSPSHHGQHDERDWFDASSLAYGQDRNLRSYAESDTGDIRENQGDFVRCKGPTKTS